MTLEAIGKLLETFGAVGIAYVGLRAARREIRVGRHLYHDSPRNESQTLTDLQTQLAKAHEFRRRQFGFKEALIVGAGTALVALGCATYLYGMFTEKTH